MWRTGTLIHYCWETVIWKKMMAPQKLSRITIWSSNSTSGYIFKKIKESSQVKKKKRKGRGIRDQIVNIHWITEKAREFQKNFHFCFIDNTKVFDCVDHNKLWKNLKEMEYHTTLPASWEVKSLSHVRLFVTPWSVACHAPLSMVFSRQEYWSGLLFPSPGDLPNPRIKPRSPALQADTTAWAIRKAPASWETCMQVKK